MSNTTPAGAAMQGEAMLWSDGDIATAIGFELRQGDVINHFDAGQIMRRMRDEYEAELAKLRAEVAALRAEAWWEPVSDGERIEIDSGGDSMGIARPSAVHVRGNSRISIEMTSLSMAGASRYLHSGKMPTGHAICRLVPGQDTQRGDGAVGTAEVQEALKTLLKYCVPYMKLNQWEREAYHDAKRTLRKMLTELKEGNDDTN